MSSPATRTALVTGGGRGIGEAIARRFSAESIRVVLTGRTTEDIERVAADTGGVAIRADLADRADTDALVAAVHERIGPIDILVNNAGIAESAPLDKISDASWDRMIAINTTAPFRLCRAFIPGMKQAGWGRVINIASNAGVSGYRYSSAYCASKHALVGLTRALAVDLARTKITINAICPGFVNTRMADQASATIATKTGRTVDQAKAALAALSPQNRVFEPDEVAHAAAMLLSDQARGIHGQTLVIDGGQILK